MKDKGLAQYNTFSIIDHATHTGFIPLISPEESIAEITTTGHYESIISESINRNYFLESRPSSTKAVTILRSGNSSLNAAIPSGAQIRFTNRILDSGMPALITSLVSYPSTEELSQQ